MTFSDHQNAYDAMNYFDNGYHLLDTNPSFFDKADIDQAIESMADEMMADTPDLQVIADLMEFICDEHEVDFDKNKFNLKGK